MWGVLRGLLPIIGKMNLRIFSLVNVYVNDFVAVSLTFPVYQTAPTGRTWLGVHQAGGASNCQ